MATDIFAEIKTTALDVQKAIEHVSFPSHGAIDLFVGVIRNNHEGQAVSGITFDAHPALATKVMRKICEEAQGLWGDTHYYVAHYSGYLPVGGASIVIAVSSPHRCKAFEACKYIIDEVKQRVPVWKKEHYVDGASQWLPGHQLESEI